MKDTFSLWSITNMSVIDNGTFWHCRWEKMTFQPVFLKIAPQRPRLLYTVHLQCTVHCTVWIIDNQLNWSRSSWWRSWFFRNSSGKKEWNTVKRVCNYVRQITIEIHTHSRKRFPETRERYSATKKESVLSSVSDLHKCFCRSGSRIPNLTCLHHPSKNYV